MIGKDKTRLILTIPKKYVVKLKKYAEKHKMTVSEYIRKAIYIQLDREVYRTKREREERIQMIEGIKECEKTMEESLKECEKTIEESLDDKEFDMKDVPKEIRGFMQSKPSEETRRKAKKARSKKRKKRK